MKMMNVLKLITLIAFSSLPYIFSLKGDFVFDDSEAIINNPDMNLSVPYMTLFEHDFWGSNLKSNTSHKSYRPLTVLTFRFNKILDGGELIALNFKITNLILHCFVTIGVYIVYTMIIKRLKECKDDYITYRDIDDQSYKQKIFDIWNNEAFLLSVVFAVHPVHVEAVSGIVGRADVLAALMILLVLFYYNKFLQCFNSALSFRNLVKTSLYFVGVILLSATAMLFKETGITALGLCCLYDFTFEYDLKILLNFKSKSKRAEGMPSTKIDGSEYNYFRKYFITRQLLLSASALCLLYIRWALMNFQRPEFHDIDNPAAFSDFYTRIMTYNYIYFLNILIFIWPQWLCFDWSMGCVSLIRDFKDFRLIFVLAFWLFIILILHSIISFKRCNFQKRYLLICVSFLVIPYLPASNILMPVGFVIAERVLYTPSIGFCALIVRGFLKLLTTKKTIVQNILKMCFLFWIIIMILRTIQRSHDWIDEEKLFNTALGVCPLNAKVHYNIGKNSADNHNFIKAENSYKKAIELYSRYYQAMNNLANLYKDQKRFQEAKTLLHKALSIKTDFPAAWMNLGIVLSNINQHEEAEKAYLTALKYRRKYPDCYYNLGNLYLEKKQHEAALASWSEATKLDPKHAVAWSNILALLDNTGQIDRALILAPLALAELSDVAAINFNIANLLGKKERFEEAERHFIKAINLRKNDPSALYYTNLGVLYHRWRKTNLAIEMYKKALSVDPLYKSAKENLHKLQ